MKLPVCDCGCISVLQLPVSSQVLEKLMNIVSDNIMSLTINFSGDLLVSPIAPGLPALPFIAFTLTSW